jgi:DNA-binding MarR family transcriptional regulator
MMQPTSKSHDLTLGEAGDFMRSLWRFNHALERVSRRMEELRGVTIQQRLFLRFVGKYPGATASQLASYFHLDPGTISAAIARLQQKGLVSRRRTDRDRRRVVLGLTPAGRALDGTIATPVDSALEALIAEPVLAGADAGGALQNLAARLEAALEQ